MSDSSTAPQEQPTESELNAVVAALEAVRGRMSAAVAKRAEKAASSASVSTSASDEHGRVAGEADAVRLVAVSKTKPNALLQAAYGAGQRHFGENYVQELVAKASGLPRDIQWHFIGHLQSNKASHVAAIPNLFVVETVDSVKLATALEKACAKQTRDSPLRVFVQVNTSGETSKSGSNAAEAIAVARHIVNECPHLRLCGLMTIGQPGRQCSEASPNPDFLLLNEIRQQTAESLSLRAADLELSFGMSDDFEHAISMGSTNIRVGSTIFGSRSYPAVHPE
ncbi:alanine racemase [Capsaspora owczarzaki ATCC 30864]|nr:alanine racemase [Capsaspora owczarzaki ATCC 30864]|eukprot:XP_004365575.1 alanine racemase [Capsaspora owczarzaki ATCC 30864]